MPGRCPIRAPPMPAPRHPPRRPRRGPPAVLLRPGDHRKAGVVKHLVPASMLLEAVRRVIRLRRERSLVGLEEVADLCSELLGGFIEIQIHYAISRSRSLTTLPPRLRGSDSQKITDRGFLKFAKCSRL